MLKSLVEKFDTFSGDLAPHDTFDRSTPTNKPQTANARICPVCSCPLELYEYMKGNEKKQMLRCSDVQARRQDDHKDAVYFAFRGLFWSVKYGEINWQKLAFGPSNL